MPGARPVDAAERVAQLQRATAALRIGTAALPPPGPADRDVGLRAPPSASAGPCR